MRSLLSLCLPYWGWIMTSLLLMMDLTIVPGENTLLPSHWQLSHMRQAWFKPEQWWKTASSMWQCLRSLSYRKEITWTSHWHHSHKPSVGFRLACLHATGCRRPKGTFDHTPVLSSLLVLDSPVPGHDLLLITLCLWSIGYISLWNGSMPIVFSYWLACFWHSLNLIYYLHLFLWIFLFGQIVTSQLKKLYHFFSEPNILTFIEIVWIP